MQGYGTRKKKVPTAGGGRDLFRIADQFSSGRKLCFWP